MKKKIEIPKERLILFGVPIFGLLIGLLGYMALVAPQKSKASSLASQIAAARAEAAAAAKASAKPARPVPVRAADILRLTRAMPDAADVPGVIRDLTRIANATSVTLQSVKPGQPVPLPQGYGALPLGVSIVGTFSHVSAFLRELRREVSVSAKDGVHAEGRLFVTDQVGLTSGNGKTVTATLGLNAFIYGLAPPPAATTTTTGSTTTTPTGSG